MGNDSNQNAGDKAAELYHKPPERYNCAQSVLKAFDQSAEKIAEHKAYGGGRAPGGYCGALFAAESLVKNLQEKQQLENVFEKEAGSLFCKEIRGKNLVPCKQCVKIAAENLFKIPRDH